MQVRIGESKVATVPSHQGLETDGLENWGKLWADYNIVRGQLLTLVWLNTIIFTVGL
jgi:hypothetical protein